MKGTMNRVRATTAVQVVILGGGFGGRSAAQRLAHGLPSGSRITLVDQNDYMLYTPMLTEVAGRSVSPLHIQAPHSNMSRRIRVVRGTVVGADLRKRTIALSDGTTLYGDHLLFALGSVTNFRGVEGAQEYCLTMKTLEDARRLQIVAERRVEQASTETDAEQRALLLSFAIAGGGYTGVETVAALNDLVRDTAKQQGVRQEEISITVIEPARRLMAEMPESLAEYSKKQLESDGIRVIVGDSVERVGAEQIFLKSGKAIRAGTMIWDTGIIPNPLIAILDCSKGKKGGLATDSTFRVKETHNIWAVGDCAEIAKPDESGAYFEPTAQNATRQGNAVARNIIAAAHHRSLEPFRYKQIGELAVISRYRGVANVFGIQVRGLTAWLMWRSIYLAKMPGMRARLGIFIDWMRLLFGRKHVGTEWHLKT
jgi:NADH dehydrogenase